ncbi:MAG: hypothetical protein IH851_05215 [Armatimonadetes bacterium]|nr:hypothetical protein [Armatimonadota bacterium]
MGREGATIQASNRPLHSHATLDTRTNESRIGQNMRVTIEELNDAWCVNNAVNLELLEMCKKSTSN